MVLRIIKVVESLPKTPTTRVISNQLLRSATSILANYIEAQAASSRRDYTNFFHHSLKSANETKVWLASLRDSGSCGSESINPVLDELQEISKIFGASLLTLKGKK